ncbi:leucine Rich Repeat protein, partial [Faecalibacterium cf. prausnitzii KLE1255]
DVSKNTELTYLDCGYNRLTELDVSQNTKLTELYFVSNKITSLQADNCTNLTVIFTGSNKYKVEVYKKTRILDPSILPGNFDISRVRNLKGATQNADGTLTVQEGGGKVTYEYRCVGEIYKPFTLNVTETDDPNAGIVPPVTPPSGGGDSIAINASNFPDPDFRTYVKAEFDKDNNNSLNDTERKTATVINVKDKLIETLEGIEFFPNLKELDCSINQLSRLDVSQNTALEKLDCSTNQLASLNLSKNAKLKYLYCNQNELTSLDVSKNTGLDLLNCNRNRLTSLDVSQTAVTTLNASDNKIDINVEETPRTFDLSTLPGKFDVTKATNWSGGTVSGKTLKVNEGTNQVTYTYDCGKGHSGTFTLNVKVVPDGTVTPPSGGDTPGGGSTPGGSTPGGGDGGGAIVIVAAAGAVAAGVVGYGVYNYVSGRKLQALL